MTRSRIQSRSRYHHLQLFSAGAITASSSLTEFTCPTNMPTLAELEQWFEEQIPAHLSDIPTRVHDTLQAYTAQLIEHLHDLTPSIAQIESSMPSIPTFGKSIAGSNTSKSTTAVAPTAPMHFTLFHGLASRLDTLTGSRRRTSIVMGIALVGLASTVTYRSFALSRPSRRSHRALSAVPRVRNGARYDAVVVLGADTPIGQALCHTFASQGFIVVASVATNQSKQSFDALVPPSMRGYIKTIVLPQTNIQAEHVAHFVQSISSARQLRWPLTAAGDPYARPGSEVNVLAVLNALSYEASPDELVAESHTIDGQSGASVFNLERLADGCQRRAIVPLALVGALLPILTQGDDTVQAVIVSLQNSGTAQDVANQALSAGLTALSMNAATRTSARQQTRAVAVVSLQSRPASVLGTVASYLPRVFGGSSITPLSRRSAFWMPLTLLNSWRSASSASMEERHTPAATDRKDLKDHKGRQSQASHSRNVRQTEYRTVSSAAVQLVIRAATTNSSYLRSTYFVQLAQGQSAPPASFASRSITEMLSAVAQGCVSLVGSLPLLRLAMSPRSTCYSGTRNYANNRPAFGPGPGPASNTHSRSCIRANSSTSSVSSGDHHGRQQGRPRSTGSARSSGSESGGARESVVPGSAPASSAHDMSSSGLLSSVPSSAFGDLSEEEHYGDSDFADGVDSPIVGGRPGSTAGSASFQTPSSESWQHGVAASSTTESSSGMSEEHDDSGTALGSRNNTADNDPVSNEADTPQASQLHRSGPHQQGLGNDGDFHRSPAAEVGGGDDTARAMSSDVGNQDVSGSVYTPTSGVHSPLGQSWVALGRSSTQAADPTKRT